MRLLLALLVCAIPSLAADLVVGKKVYFDAKVTAVESTGIRLTHRDGTAFVDFDEMSADQQRQYGYTVEKAKARHDKAAAEAAALAERERQRLADETARQVATVKAREDRERADAAARQQAVDAAEAAKQKQTREANELRASETKRKEQEEWNRKLRDLGLWAVYAFIYFLPSIVGCKKRNRAAIWALNILAGWTFVGWVVAMVWACTKDPLPQSQTIIFQGAPPQAYRPPVPIGRPPVPRVMAPQGKQLPPPIRPTQPPQPPGP